MRRAKDALRCAVMCWIITEVSVFELVSVLFNISVIFVTHGGKKKRKEKQLNKGLRKVLKDSYLTGEVIEQFKCCSYGSTLSQISD